MSLAVCYVTVTVTVLCHWHCTVTLSLQCVAAILSLHCVTITVLYHVNVLCHCYRTVSQSRSLYYCVADCHCLLLCRCCRRCVAAKLFLDAIDKFFVGQQQEELLLKAIADNLSEIEEGERKAEEKHNKFRVFAKDSGSTK